MKLHLWSVCELINKAYWILTLGCSEDESLRLGPLYFFMEAADFHSNFDDLVRFEYEGIPFASYHTSHEVVNTSFPSRPGVYFCENGNFDHEGGVISASCGRYKTLESATASINLTVEKRLHPDIARKITITKESVHLLESGSVQSTKADLQRLQEGFDNDKALLDKISDHSQWRENISQFLENRIAENIESSSHIDSTKGKLIQALGASYDECISYQDAFSLSNLMLPLIGAELGATDFLNNCEQVELMQKVSSLLPAPPAGSKEKPSVRVQTNLLTQSGGAERVALTTETPVATM